MAHIYDSITRRNLDFSGLKLNSSEIHSFGYKFYQNGIDINMKGLQFDINMDIAKFAYLLAEWKEPQVINKPDMPYRTKNEKIYDLYIGNVTECVTNLYFKLLGVQQVRYYDLERKDNVYHKDTDYDLQLNDKKMSLKATPTTFIDDRFGGADMMIKGLHGSNQDTSDRYYTQFLVTKADGRKPNMQDYNALRENILSNSVNLYFVMLGGVVNYHNIGFKSLARQANRPAYLDTKIVFKPYFDTMNYVRAVLEDNGIYLGV